jgi:hypothetical protein
MIFMSVLFVCTVIERLLADCFADILYGFADFAFGCSEAFLNIATGAIRRSLALRLRIADRATDILLDRALGLIEFTFYLIFVW